MNQWWYEKDGVATGPVEYNELQAMLLSGSINPELLAWREGMVEWKRIDELTEFSHLPPPLPNERDYYIDASVKNPQHSNELIVKIADDAKDINVTSPTPWRRFFARTLDMAWITFILAVMFTFGINYLLENGIITEQKHVMNLYIVFILFFQPIVMIIDAIITSNLGVNIGKMLLGLRVQLVNGRSPSFSSILNRNMNVLISGVGFSIPLISILTNAYQFHHLKRYGSTSYDVDKFIVVSDRDYNIFPFIFFSIALVSAYNWYGSSYDTTKIKVSTNKVAEADRSKVSYWRINNLSDEAKRELEEIKTFAADIPKNIDEDIRYESFFIDKNKKILSFAFIMKKLSADSVNGKDFYDEIRPKEVLSVCSGYKHLADDGVSFFIMYRDKFNNPISSVFVSKSDCIK